MKQAMDTAEAIMLATNMAIAIIILSAIGLIVALKS
jgi:hypothetical protein